jgi:sulfide:quinone oxidoreductase
MAQRIVIIGAGTGGTLVANRLQRRCGDHAQITVVDRDDRHVYQPGLLFVPFAMARPGDLVRSRREQLHRAVAFRVADVDRVEAEASTVHLADGSQLGYDVLVVASGVVLQPEETEGLTGPGWGERMHTFYTPEGASALRGALERMRSGRLVVNPVEQPIKCPVAPLEFCFLADWHLRQRGLRDEVEIVYATNLDGAFTKPVAAAELAGLLERKQIKMETEFATGRVDGESGRLQSWDEREIGFDLLVTVPLHGGAPFVGRSPGLGDELSFVRTDPATLRAHVAPNVFALGDATDAPTSKAGSVAHFEGETVVENVCRQLAGEELEASYDGHVNCFIETGFHKALLVDFNYEVEPLPGRFPLPRLGPLPLLAESRRNHLAKLAFEWFYWNALLPGRPMPGITPAMQLAGKQTRRLAGQPA